MITWQFLPFTFAVNANLNLSNLSIVARAKPQREAMAAEPLILAAKPRENKGLRPILPATSPPVFTLRCQNFTSHANNPASYAS